MSVAGSDDDVSTDQLVAQWRNRIDTIARNLTDFNNSEEWRRVRARLRAPADAVSLPAYKGETLRAAQAIEVAFEGLWKDYLLVQSVVGEALAKASKRSLLSNRDAEIRWLLTSDSIKLPTISMPIEKRDLLDDPDTQELLSPNQALASMRDAFRLARDGVFAIVETQDEIAPRIAPLRAEMEALRRRAESAGLDCAALGAAVFPTPGEIGEDPLGCSARLGEIERLLTRLEADTGDAENQIAALKARLPKAEEKLAELRRAAQKARAAVDDCARRIVEAEAFDPAIDAEIESLAQWLGVIKETFAAGRWRAAAVGFGKWEAACAGRLAALEELRRRAHAPLDRLEDVAGRFRALLAMAEKLGADKAGAPLAPAELAARAEIGRAPCSLTEAGRLVDAYELALRDWRNAS